MYDQHEDNWGYESLYTSMACVDTRPSARTPRELLYGDDDEDCCDVASLPEAVGAGLSDRALSEYSEQIGLLLTKNDRAEKQALACFFQRQSLPSGDFFVKAGREYYPYAVYL
ncbi:hypothetical protein MTO96_011375 [Rhipicephalus appendiculatus]